MIGRQLQRQWQHASNVFVQNRAVFPGRKLVIRMVKNSALADTSKEGAFVRQASQWREHVSTAPGSKFAPEAGRYHLYVSLACPWACRTLAALYLKGLDHAIGVSVVHPTWQRTKPDDPEDQHAGWTFADPKDAPFASVAGYGKFPPTACIPDTINGAKYVRDLYEKAGQKGGRYTVPVLWDKKEGTIVNNESSDILRMLNSAFQDIARNKELDLYPEDQRAKIDELNEWIYHKINNGVYRAGFAQQQAAYEEAFRDVFSGLDQVESILSKQRYLTGSKLTEADIRLFVTLIRFDEVYTVYFKTNKTTIAAGYPNIKAYVQDLYQTPGIKESVNMYHIKTHYYTSHPTLNHYAIVPLGAADTPWWEQPHDRATRFNEPASGKA